MALFKLLRGQESDLVNQPLHDGYVWVTKDLNNMWFDYYDETNTLVRKRINAEYADKLRYVKDGATIELDPSEIATKDYVTTQLSGKADTSHTHDDRYYTEDEIDAKLDSLNVNPDWSQNDPDAPDYIENRTHWFEPNDPEIIFNDIIQTTGVGSLHSCYLQMSEPLVVGSQYLVTFNGKEYLLTAQFDGNYVFIGDLNYDFTTIPFLLQNEFEDEQFLATPINIKCNLKIKLVKDVVHQIDEKFIPDTIARVSNWTQIYDSGVTTQNVSAFAYINTFGYKNIMVAIKAVNTTASAGNTGGSITFTGGIGKKYAFNNILPDLIKNNAVTTGGVAIFKIVDGFIVCENAMRSTSADNMLSTTEAAGADNLVPVGGGLIRCTDVINNVTISNTNSSNKHYFGTGSRVIVWGCK